ncbi:unnamed protein product [Heterobilharzia americana]|nr:unnamed protein product [Heterobilharzia americana]
MQYTRMISEVRQSDSITADYQKAPIDFVTLSNNFLLPSLKTSGGKLSGPAALYSFRFDTPFSTSRRVGGPTSTSHLGSGWMLEIWITMN